MAPRACVVAKDQGTFWLRRQGRTRSKSSQIHSIGDHFNTGRWDFGNTFDPLPASGVDRYVSQDSRKIERLFHEQLSAMTDIDGRDLWKMGQGFDYLRVVVPVNDVGWLCEVAELVCDFDATVSNLLSHRTQ